MDFFFLVYLCHSVVSDSKLIDDSKYWLSCSWCKKLNHLIFSPHRNLHVATTFSFLNRVTRHQTDCMVCCSTALFNSIRVFHDNQLGSTPWISPGAYNHHTPSAQTGTGEPHPPVARTLQCNITGPLGAMKRQFVVYFKAFYSRLCSFFPLALGSVLNVDFPLLSSTRLHHFLHIKALLPVFSYVFWFCDNSSSW